MDATAFERLFERHFDDLYGYLARRVGRELGRDLAAETFTRAFAARRRYEPQRGEPRAWLFGIAQNLLRRHYRDEERRLRALARVDVFKRGCAAGGAAAGLSARVLAGRRARRAPALRMG